MQETLHRPAVKLTCLLQRAIGRQVFPGLDIAFSCLYAVQTGANQLFGSDFPALKLGDQ
jgi:hypothetical protein